MDLAGVERAVVVGLSMGGYVAFRLLAQAGERVLGLVLADTRAGPDDEAGRARRTDQAARVRAEGTGWLSDAFAPALLGETTLRERPGVEAAVRGMMNNAEPEGVARALEAMRDRPDSSGSLREIGVPVLVVVGEEDTLTPPAEARKIADGVGNGRLVVLPGAGHLANLEDPGAFNQALTSFLG
jgi:3-oxoadipate enol-lactonase